MHKSLRLLMSIATVAIMQVVTEAATTKGQILWVSQLHKRVYLRFDNDYLLDVGSEVKIDTSGGRVNTDIVFSGKNITIARSGNLDDLKQIKIGDPLESSGKVIFKPDLEDRHQYNQPLSYIGSAESSFDLASVPDPSKYKEYQNLSSNDYRKFASRQKQSREQRIKQKGGSRDQNPIDAAKRIQKYQYVKDEATDFTMQPIKDKYLRQDMAADVRERKARIRRLKREEEDRLAKRKARKAKEEQAKKAKKTPNSSRTSKYKYTSMKSSKKADYSSFASSKTGKSDSVSKSHSRSRSANDRLAKYQDTAVTKKVKTTTKVPKTDYMSKYKVGGTGSSSSQAQTSTTTTVARRAPVGSLSTRKGHSAKEWYDKSRSIRDHKIKIEYLMNALEAYPAFTNARIDLATTYVSMGVKELAELELQTAIEMDAKNGKAYNHLAEFYKQKREYGKAIVAIKNGIRAVPNMKILHCTAGEIYELQGDARMAIEEYSKALADPKWGRYARKQISRLQK